MSKRIIVTGGAGFIGSNLCDYLLATGNEVVCIDSFDDYYEPEIKRNNICKALTNSNFTLIESDIKDIDLITSQISGSFDAIIHLAAKAGVRYSLKHPEIYYEVNVNGTQAICELCMRVDIQKIIFSSSSSVYGNNPDIPWNENSKLCPLSPYADSKVKAEQILVDFATDSKIELQILRLFSVYGPRMRPDLMMNKIFNAVSAESNLTVFGDGNSKRDYTYIGDVVSLIYNSIQKSFNQIQLFNIGNKFPVSLIDLIHLFEEKIGKNAKINYLQKLSVEPDVTFTTIELAQQILDYKPTTDINSGINSFINWRNNNPKI
ncbi:MAG: GDP-mannose 4,6-dehydratase [Bacteroidales bacterium]|nr:GDP-mannose 4,6-dehydratase [Bacteroidales bacterium]